MISGMKNITVYGIPNCDTVRRARAWLDEAGLPYTFHDYKKQGVPEALLPVWLERLGRDVLINRKGPTWRKLDPALQASVVDDASAALVLLAHSSVIKRPLISWPDGSLTVGFAPEIFARHAS
jgi:arsenate reductase (glutaredoxin)